MIVKLSKCEVEIKEAFTWGDREKIQATLMKGANINSANSIGADVGFDFDTDAMLESKYKALECAVVKIMEKKDEKLEEIKWSKDWQDNLTVEDGDKLMESVDALSKKK